MADQDAGAIVLRSCGLGAGVGAVSGGVWGSMNWPVVGTFYGAIGGTLAGLGAGAVTGLVLMVGSSPGRPRWLQRSNAAAGTMVALVVFALFTPGLGPCPGPSTWVGIVAASALVAAAAAPCLLRGAYLKDLGRWHSTRPVSDWALRLMIWGAAGGGIPGAITGVVIGAHVYLPTAGFALIEGAALGAASGIVVALGLGGLVLSTRVRART